MTGASAAMAKTARRPHARPRQWRKRDYARPIKACSNVYLLSRFSCPAPTLTLLPIGCTSVATPGLPFLSAARTEDGRLVAAGLLARGSNVLSCLPKFPMTGMSVASRRGLAAYSCGRSHGIDVSISPCSLLAHAGIRQRQHRHASSPHIAHAAVKRNRHESEPIDFHRDATATHCVCKCP